MQRVLQRQGTFQMDRHFEKAGDACGHIDDLVASLTQLHEDCSKWRAKYMQMKRTHFAKFLGSCDSQRVQTAFRAWRDLWQDEKAGREYNKLISEEGKSAKEWEMKLRNQEWECAREIETLQLSQKRALGDLMVQMSMREGQLQKLISERDTTQSCSEQSMRVLQSITAQLSCVDDEGEVQMLEDFPQPEPRSLVDQVLRKVHNLLECVDAQYVPPINVMASVAMLSMPGTSSNKNSGSSVGSASR